MEITVIVNPYKKLAMDFPSIIVDSETGIASCVSKVPFVRSRAKVVTPIEELPKNTVSAAKPGSASRIESPRPIQNVRNINIGKSKPIITVGVER